jgi:hypothetical protein
MRILLLSFLMIPLAIGCSGGGNEKPSADADADADTDADADADADFRTMVLIAAGTQGCIRQAARAHCIQQRTNQESVCSAHRHTEPCEVRRGRN